MFVKDKYTKLITNQDDNQYKALLSIREANEMNAQLTKTIKELRHGMSDIYLMIKNLKSGNYTNV